MPTDLMSSVDYVYQKTRYAILTGEYPPGSQLRLQALATQNGVSMIPVREALRLLEAEGFVESIPNRGARVASLSLQDLRDVYRTRIVLETEALRQAVPHITRPMLAHARELNERIALQFAEQGYAQYEDHRAFHFALYEPSGSKWLMKLISIVWDHTERYRRQGSPQVTPECARDEHEWILTRIDVSDAEGAAAALHRHLTNSLARTQAVFESEMSASNEALSVAGIAPTGT